MKRVRSLIAPAEGGYVSTPVALRIFRTVLTPVAVIAVITVIRIFVLPPGIGVVGLTSPHVLTSYEGSILVAKGEASVTPFIAADRIRSAPVAVSAGIAAVITVVYLIVVPTAIAIFPIFVSAIVVVAMVPVSVIPATVIAIMVVTITAIPPMVTGPVVVIIIATLGEGKSA